MNVDVISAGWKHWFIGCAAALGAVITQAGDPNPSFPSNEDLRHVRGLSNPQLSPDGRQVLLQVADATADGGRTHLWIVEVGLGSARALTVSPAADKRGEYQGRWLGSGSIVFLAKRNEHTQLYRLPLAGGEAVPFDLAVSPVVDASTAADALPPHMAGTDTATPGKLPIDVDLFEPSPDGRTIALTAKDPETPGEKKQKDQKADAIRVNHDPHGKRLYLLDTETGALTATSAPPDVDAIAWDPTGARLIAVVEGPNHAAELGPARSAWIIERADPQHARGLAGMPPTIQRAAWSADGLRLALVAQSAGDVPPGYWSLYEWTLRDGVLHPLSKQVTPAILDVTPLIGADGEVIQAADLGTRRGYLRFHGDRPAEFVSFGSPVNGGLNTNAKHTGWVWIGQGADQPPALYFAAELGQPPRALSAPQVPPAIWPSVRRQAVQWRNAGLTIEGLLYLPPQAQHARVPLIVDVHGGPLGSWHESFDPFVFFLLGQGWAVLRPNPRGSTGYGASFAAANKNDLGGGDFRDIMTGVDAVIAQHPIDPDAVALVGYSYGGEMAGFAEGKTRRFKAIVSGAPVIDQQSEYGTEEDPWYDRWYYGLPWLNVRDAWRQSPLSGVAQAKTPFLLIQGEDDSTDPLGQSLEMYRALRQMGVPVELIQYPREDHGPLSRGWSGLPSTEPWHGFDVRQRIITFLRAHLPP